MKVVQNLYCFLILHFILIILTRQMDEDINKNKQSSYFKDFLMISNITVGVLIYYLFHLQNIEQVNEQGHSKQFFHPYMQTLLMFIGELLCMGIYLITKSKLSLNQQTQNRIKQAEAQGKIVKFNKLILAIPAFCDFLASVCNFFALNFIPGSIYNMSDGFTTVFTLAFTRLLIKIIIKKYQIFGCFLSVVGVTIVGLSTLLFEGITFHVSLYQQILGYTMIIGYAVMSGLAMAVEQKIFDKYHVQPLLFVGYEGIFGIFFISVTITIFTFIQCPFGQSACVYANNGKMYFERPQVFMKQVFQSTLQIILVILIIVVVSLYNASGLFITKYIDATTRSLMSLATTVIVWILGAIVTLTAGKNNPKYSWQQLGYRTVIMSIAGFILIILGVLMYCGKLRVFSQETPQDKSLLTENKTEDN